MLSTIKKLGIVFMVLARQDAYACNTEPLGVGPRLLKAKACFGTVLRVCGPELVALTKLVKPANRVMGITEYCKIVNACKDAVEELTTDMMRDCVMDHMRNTSSKIYTLIDDPPKFVDRFNDLLRCGLSSKVLDAPWPVLDDAYNVFYKAIKNFGGR